MWQVDTGIFDEKILLPITGITYKGVKFEGQHTKINVGPLTCHPTANQYDFRQHLATIEQKTNENLNAFEIKLNTLEQTDVKQDREIQSLQSVSNQEKTEEIEKIANHESRIDTLEKNDLEQEEKIKGLMPQCPSGKLFQFINGKCYAFENVGRTYEATQTRCGQIFGHKVGGKIFEPRSDQVIKEVLEYAKIAWAGDSSSNPRLWLGITDESSENNFVYHSDGQSHKLSSTFYSFYSLYPNSRSVNCVYTHHSWGSVGLSLVHFSCSVSLVAICEWVI